MNLNVFLSFFLGLLSICFAQQNFCGSVEAINKSLIENPEKKQILDDLKTEKLSLINQINDLDFKNSLLSDNLDLDYIETLIRERFLFGKKNEKIYIIKKDDTKN